MSSTYGLRHTYSRQEAPQSNQHEYAHGMDDAQMRAMFAQQGSDISTNGGAAGAKLGKVEPKSVLKGAKASPTEKVNMKAPPKAATKMAPPKAAAPMKPALGGGGGTSKAPPTKSMNSVADKYQRLSRAQGEKVIAKEKAAAAPKSPGTALARVAPAARPSNAPSPKVYSVKGASSVTSRSTSSTVRVPGAKAPSAPRASGGGSGVRHAPLMGAMHVATRAAGAAQGAVSRLGAGVSKVAGAAATSAGAHLIPPIHGMAYGLSHEYDGKKPLEKGKKIHHGVYDTSED